MQCRVSAEIKNNETTSSPGVQLTSLTRRQGNIIIIIIIIIMLSIQSNKSVKAKMHYTSFPVASL